MKRPRILILKTGPIPDELETEFGDHTSWFTSVLGAPERFTIAPVFDGQVIPSFLGHDAIIITGSPRSICQFEPWMRALEEQLLIAIERGMPILGVCFGHQLIAHALGAQVVLNPRGREVGTVSVELTDEGRADPMFEGVRSPLEVQTTHCDIVSSLPAGAVLLGGNAQTEIQAVRFGDRVYGLQFHPELSDRAVRSFIHMKRALFERDGVDVDRVAKAIRPTPAGARILRNFESKIADRTQMLGFSTRAIHTHVDSGSIPSEPIATPIYQTASFAFERNDDIAIALQSAGHAHVYSRLSNPTVDTLERGLASLEGSQAALAFASGMAAIHAVAATLCGAGDHIVAPASLYGGSFALFKNVLPRFGIETTFVRTGELDRIREAIRPNTKIVYAETIGNPALFIADIPRLATLAHERGALCVVDSTFASPYLCRPLAHGADLVVHSASKYLGGHGDLIAGMVAGSKELVERIRHIAIDIGGVCSPFVAWLILRGLKTLSLRMERHVASARKVAEMLSKHPRVKRAIYPGLASHPQHDLATKLLPRGAGGIVAFELDGDREEGARVIDALELFKRAGSLGDTHSLALQPASTSHRQLDRAQLAEAGISEGFIRLSIGLEDVEDIIGDLTNALDLGTR